MTWRRRRFTRSFRKDRGVSKMPACRSRSFWIACPSPFGYPIKSKARKLTVLLRRKNLCFAATTSHGNAPAAPLCGRDLIEASGCCMRRAPNATTDLQRCRRPKCHRAYPSLSCKHVGVGEGLSSTFPSARLNYVYFSRRLSEALAGLLAGWRRFTRCRRDRRRKAGCLGPD